MPTTNPTDLPSPDSPARAPVRPFTENEIRVATEVLGRPEVQGNIAVAATILEHEHPETNWHYQRLRKLLKRLSVANSQVASADPEDTIPTEGEALDRPPVMTPTEVAATKGLLSQEKLLVSGDWEKMGLTAEQGEKMVSLERFARMPLGHMIRTTHGGLMLCLANLLTNFEDTARRIKDGDIPEEFTGDGKQRPAIDVERDWHKLLLGYTAEIRAITDQVTRSNILLLKAKQLENDPTGKKKKGKPGFSPVLVNAQPGSTVIANGAQD